MYFTQEDYRKIEAWLYKRVVRDTDFPNADPLSGTEKVPLIQDGKNKTINLNDFVKRVADMKLPDFYNVTTASRKSWLTLKEAVALVPVEQRKLGLTITFHNENGNWLIYQFNGTSLNQWDSLNYWNNIIQQALEELVVYPDEEDITGVRDGNRTFLKFKDKDYDPADFSGMGRIILRKNLVGTEACSLDDEDHLLNVLTQDMIREENTVYIIQYDFDLDGKVISIPKGCTLWFQGGSINNGTIYLQETAILGAFEFADMGSIKLFGKFNTGQIMTFFNDSYKRKSGGYFLTNTTKPSSATEEEDPKNDVEVFYKKNPNSHTEHSRRELRWWNGEEWLLILDITDYNEIRAIIEDLIEKHNAEMSACYKYFKKRCYDLEVRVTNVEGDIVNIKQDIANINENISNIENNITDVTNNIEDILQKISNIDNIINNLEETINNYIQEYIQDLVVGVTSVTVNGTKYTPDENGNITLPDYPENTGGDGGIADSTKGTLRFTGASTAEYNGSQDVTVHIPEVPSGGGDGGTADKVAHKLKFTGAVVAEYDGSKEVSVNIPAGGGGSTFEPKTLTIQDQKGNTKATYNATTDRTLKVGSLLIRRNDGDTLHDAVDGKETLLDLRPIINGTSDHYTILYNAEIVRTFGSTNWREQYSHKHEGLGSVTFTTNDSLLKITLGAKSGWNIKVGTISANVRDMVDMRYFDTIGGRYRSTGAWVQCATNNSYTAYLRVWRLDNNDNDSLNTDCLHKDGKCLGLSIMIVGYAVKI